MKEGQQSPAAEAGILWEFQATNRCIGRVRGRVRANDYFAARKRLKAKGYRVEDVWRFGKNQLMRDDRYQDGLVVPMFVRIDTREPRRLVYRRRTWLYILGGCVLAGMAAMFILVSVLAAEEPLRFRWALSGPGFLLLLLAIGGVLSRATLVIDGDGKTVRVETTFYCWKWVHELSAMDASAVILDKKDWVSMDGTLFLYVVSLENPLGEHWPLLSTTSLRPVKQFASDIADVLGLPLHDMAE